MPFVMSDVVRELDLRASKKANIVLSGVRPSPPLSDNAVVNNLLHTELGINATVVRCSRLGKPSANPNRPQLLLATLSSDADSRAAIRSATKLRSSTDAHVRDHVYLNADLTMEQRKLDYELRTELKLRRAAGEQDLVIRVGKLHTKHSRSVATTVPAAARNDSLR